ncbi:MAG: V-type ATP synthase subunit I [Roseburia sp.]|nr:V-type ATP synthase subunit I [Roseburia sp.]
MAIAKMTHVRIVGLRKSENKIIDGLAERGLFEARETDEIPFDLERGEAAILRELKTKQSRIVFALDFIKQRHSAMSAMLKAAEKRGEKAQFALSDRKFKDVRVISDADFSDTRAREYELLNVCDTLQKLSFDIVGAQSRIAELENRRKTYEPFAACPLKFSDFKRHDHVTVALYYSASQPKSAWAALDEYGCAYDIINTQSGALAVIVCRHEDDKDLERALSALGVSRCAVFDDCTAKDKLDALDAETADVRRHIFELTKTSLDYEKYYDDLCVLYDVLESAVERAEADGGCLKTDSTFVLEGWIPESDVESITREIGKSCPDTLIQLLAPEEKDAPPTLVVSNKIVEPYESVTNMYSPPKYREIDPNPVMSVFFCLFFGLMVGDAAYGVILAALGLALGLCGKFRGETRRLMLLVGMGGVAAIFWGVLFGSYFAIDFGSNSLALWFNPMEDPMTLLIVSIVLGAVQITVGYIIKFVKLCQAKDILSAISDAGSIILLFIALGFLGISMALDSAPKGLTTAAIVLAVTGLALLVLLGGHKNKNPIGKIFGGLTGVYGLINLLSDVLSYCRLFGLALSSAAIGFAFNTLGLTLGMPVGIIIMIPLHVFNIALGVLSAYVHDIRLQVLEFYGKFYDGEGRLFRPLGSRAKYTVIAPVNSGAPGKKTVNKAEAA